MGMMSSALLGRWVHSREEDTEHLRTYRPSHWSLPLSRVPRHLLELEPNGRVVSYVGGAADSRAGREGRWNLESRDSNLLRLVWQDTRQPALIEVIACSEEALQVRVVSGSIE
jgi:hypothetical protein